MIKSLITLAITMVTLSFSCSILAVELAEIPENVTLFKNVKVFNGTEDKLHDVDVLVVKNKIHKVAKDIPSKGTWEIDAKTGVAKEVVPAIPGMGDYSSGYTIFKASPEGISEKRSVSVNVIDGGGRTLMPGLIDAHVHLNFQHVVVPRGFTGQDLVTWEEIGILAKEAVDEYLPAGVTTVRDLCGTGPGMRKHIDAGTAVGPRIYVSGACISQTSGHGDWRPDAEIFRAPGEMTLLERLGSTVLADGADEVLKATRNNLAAGNDFAKMMSGGGITSERDPIESVQGTMEELRAMVIATKQFGTIGAVHSYHDESVQNALNAGVMSIEHGNLMKAPETFELMAEKGAWIVPAMAAFAGEILQHPYYGDPKNPAYEKTKMVNDNTETWIKLANEYNVNMGWGSDVILVNKDVWRGSRDFQITQWGRSFGNFRTLKAMTSDNGKLMALTGVMNPYPDGKLGVIEEGAYADIILVDGNPLEDLSVIGASPKMFGVPPRPTSSVDTIPLVMKDGKVYKNTL